MKLLALSFCAVVLVTSAVAQPTISSLSGPNFAPEQKDSLELSPQENKLVFFEPSYFQETASSDEHTLQKSPGIALLSSAIIPGSGQALHGKWGRAAVYALVEVAGILYYFDRNNTAKANEQSYQDYANQHWSPLAYAQWLVAYNRANEMNTNLAQLDALEDHVAGKTPDFNYTPNDWSKLDINLVRIVENQTRFVLTSGEKLDAFSHHLQDYGSQQYYELMSKYYQFQPGWKDFYEQWLADGENHVYRYSWDRNMITPNFIEGRDRAKEFNDNYKQAGNILTLIMVNHIISAFDAYFTVKLKNSRIETQANVLPYQQGALSITWHF